MARGKIYTGITLEGEILKIARVRVEGKKLTLVNLDQARLVQRPNDADIQPQLSESVFEPEAEEMELDIDESIDESIFGIEDALDDDADELDLEAFEDLDSGEADLGLDFDNLEEEDPGMDMGKVDMAEEADTPSSNELLLYNLFSAFDPKRVDVGLGIPSGNTIFQILKDMDFNDTKKKDLQVIIDDRVEAFHGEPKTEDLYSYQIREDGSMLLASLDTEPALVGLVNRTQDLFNGKLFVSDVVPEEMLLLGLINTNYDLSDDTITGVIKFGAEQSRVLFLKGNKLWIVSPIIMEGINSNKFLSTVFSKILFQLDTGEVPNLDKLIICNNSLGEEAIEFFEDRFSDVDVSEIKFDNDIFDSEITSERSIASYTTTIAAAWQASGISKKTFPDITFLPKYVKDRQKILKLQWHGFVLLALIFMVPFAFNYFYTANNTQINSLENEIRNMDQQITALEPTVREYNRISAEMTNIQGTLALLDTLSIGTLRWSTNFEQINEGVSDLENIWLTSVVSDEDYVITADGISSTRESIAAFADLFESATLTNVSSSIIRGKEVYSFTYVIRDVFAAPDVYNPESTKGINEIVGN